MRNVVRGKLLHLLCQRARERLLCKRKQSLQTNKKIKTQKKKNAKAICVIHPSFPRFHAFERLDGPLQRGAGLAFFLVLGDPACGEARLLGLELWVQADVFLQRVQLDPAEQLERILHQVGQHENII